MAWKKEKLRKAFINGEKWSKLPSSHRQSCRPTLFSSVPAGPPRCPFYTFPAGHKRNVSHLLPRISFQFPLHLHFISSRFPYNVTPIQHSLSHRCCCSLSLFLLLSLHLLLPKRRRDFSSIAEKVIFSLLQISRSVLSFVFARFHSFDLFISRFLFSFRSLVFGMQIGRSVVDRFWFERTCLFYFIFLWSELVSPQI